MALFKFQNLNKYGNLRTRIVHSPTSQFSFNPSGYGKFVNVQRFYYEMKHTYLSASLYTDANGDKFILPSREKVHPETTLADIKNIKPKIKATRSKTIEQTFNSSSSDAIYNTKYYPDSGKYHCDCPGTWRTRGNCKHVKQMRSEIEEK